MALDVVTDFCFDAAFQPGPMIVLTVPCIGGDDRLPLTDGVRRKFSACVRIWRKLTF